MIMKTIFNHSNHLDCDPMTESRAKPARGHLTVCDFDHF